MMTDEPRHIRLIGIASGDSDTFFEAGALRELSQELLSPDALRLDPNLLHRCQSWIVESVSDVLQQTQLFNGHEDPGVYTGKSLLLSSRPGVLSASKGLAGIALMLLRLWRSKDVIFGQSSDSPTWDGLTALQWAHKYIVHAQYVTERKGRRGRLKEAGFYGSNIGVHCVFAAIHLEMGDEMAASRVISRVLDAYDRFDLDAIPSESLYGLSGYCLPPERSDDPRFLFLSGLLSSSN
jgi:hypothetical protein